MIGRALLSCAVLAGLAAPCAAQARQPVFVEGIAGHTVFGDDGAIHHGMGGASARWRVLDRVRLGPEVVYLVGPGSDRDLVLSATMTFDALRPRRVTPFLLVGAGVMLHSSNFGSDTSGMVSFGAGVRVEVTDRLFTSGEFRLGWYPHIRTGVSVGYRF